MLLDRLNRNAVAMVHDCFMAAASFWLAMWLRLGDSIIDLEPGYLGFASALFTAIAFGVFAWMRFYRGLWRYASLQDLEAIIKAATLSVLIFAITMFVFARLESIPRSVPFIQWGVLILLLGGPRFVYRTLRDHTFSLDRNRKPHGGRIPLLIIGADDTTELFLRETLRDPQTNYHVLAVIDDAPANIGRSMMGIRIYGDLSKLPQVVHKLERRGTPPQRIIVSDECGDPAMLRRILEYADRLGLPLGRLPRMSQVKHGIDEKPQIRAIALEDLLGRRQQVHDRTIMRQLVEGKRVLVTGAGGTIGSELAHQIAALHPSKILCLDLSEYALYQIDQALQSDHPELARECVLGDVRDREHVDQVLQRFRPDIVFHAAAVKHVPLSESNPEEAIRTNVFGTRVVADACVAHGVGVMVMISTDKAVNPGNIMGASKKLAETYCQTLGADQSATQFITVRFGNVLGSTGSVVPLFQQQLARGGPLTVTHPEVTRYFMTVREAVELVLQAAVLGVSMMGKPPCIFVLDMGEPVKIVDLAEQVIRLGGLRPHEDIQIQFVGLRPGEKMFEELFHTAENAKKTAHEGIYLANPRHADLASLKPALDKLHQACLNRDREAALAMLKQLVPEYQPSEDHVQDSTRTVIRLR